MNKELRKYYERARIKAVTILINKHKKEYNKLRKECYIKLLNRGLK